MVLRCGPSSPPAITFTAAGGTGTQSGSTGTIHDNGNHRPNVILAQQPMCTSSDYPLFSIIPAGNGPFTLRWQYDVPAGSNTAWQDLFDGVIPGCAATIAGADTGTITITNPDACATSHHYRCHVVNACGSTDSDPALFLCYSDFNCDTFVNGVDFDTFVQAFSDGDPASDVNHDGFVNGIDFDTFVEHFEAGC